MQYDVVKDTTIKSSQKFLLKDIKIGRNFSLFFIVVAGDYFEQGLY